MVIDNENLIILRSKLWVATTNKPRKTNRTLCTYGFSPCMEPALIWIRFVELREKICYIC